MTCLLGNHSINVTIAILKNKLNSNHYTCRQCDDPGVKKPERDTGAGRGERSGPVHVPSYKCNLT